MSMRSPAWFISAFFDPLKNPDAPTSPAATGGDTSASVTFTAPSNVGGSAVTGYGVISTPGNIIGTAASSPISITGLINGTAYTFAVWATNTYGPSAFSAASGSITPQSQRGVFAGGYNGTAAQYTTQYISIPTTGNATSYGSLTVNRYSFAGVGSTTRGVFACGFKLDGGGDPVFYGTVDYITIASDGNAASFGTTLSPSREAIGSCNSSTRGIFAGGADFSRTSVIQYITIATTGSYSNFGSLLDGYNRFAGCASPTRGVFGGGFTDSSANTSRIQYITIATTGNATSFGTLASVVLDLASCSSSTRGIFAGGDPSSRIQYVTIASTGDATSFGTLSGNTPNVTGVSSELRGVFGGNINTGSSVMSYITIATTGNAATFGNLVSSTWSMAGCSNCSGGVQ